MTLGQSLKEMRSLLVCIASSLILRGTSEPPLKLSGAVWLEGGKEARDGKEWLVFCKLFNPESAFLSKF